MNERTSRRSFVTLATGALAALAAGIGRVFEGPAGRPHAQLETEPRDPMSEAVSVTTYTYDARGRLLSVTSHAPEVASMLAPSPIS